MHGSSSLLTCPASLIYKHTHVYRYICTHTHVLCALIHALIPKLNTTQANVFFSLLKQFEYAWNREDSPYVNTNPKPYTLNAGHETQIPIPYMYHKIPKARTRSPSPKNPKQWFPFSFPLSQYSPVYNPIYTLL